MFILNEKLSTKIKGFLSEFCFNEQMRHYINLHLPQILVICSCFGCRLNIKSQPLIKPIFIFQLLFLQNLLDCAAL